MSGPGGAEAPGGPATVRPLGAYRILPGITSWWGRALLVAAGVVLALAAIVGLVALLVVGSSVFDQRAFDRSAWLAAGSRDTEARTVRGRLSRSLLEDHLRLGMTRDEVVDLVGKPDTLHAGADGVTSTAVYWLGGDGSYYMPLGMYLALTFERDTMIDKRRYRD